MNKETVIRFNDVNVDGCGTDIITDANIIGPPVTETIVNNIKKVIETRKEELNHEWETDDILNAVEEYLKSIGYAVKWLNVVPDIEIEF